MRGYTVVDSSRTGRLLFEMFNNTGSAVTPRRSSRPSQSPRRFLVQRSSPSLVSMDAEPSSRRPSTHRTLSGHDRLVHASPVAGSADHRTAEEHRRGDLGRPRTPCYEGNGIGLIPLGLYPAPCELPGYVQRRASNIQHSGALNLKTLDGCGTRRPDSIRPHGAATETARRSQRRPRSSRSEHAFPNRERRCFIR